MDKNTQYLYEYQDGKRIRNIGFMKIEKQMDKSVIQIYARGLDDVIGIVFQRKSGEEYTTGWKEEISINEQAVKAEEISEKLEEQELPNEEIEIEEYITPSNVIYEKIQRQDLSRLPRKEWRIANNSFLLHGYYNYHHLLYIKEEEEIRIGVPGIFHEKEQIAAKSFGFTEFRRLTNNEIQLEENERNIYEDFGYWCRQIPC